LASKRAQESKRDKKYVTVNRKNTTEKQEKIYRDNSIFYRLSSIILQVDHASSLQQK